jgi:rubrerythrin
MFSQIPFDPKNLKKEDAIKEMLRVAIVAEFDVINLYEQLAAAAIGREDIKKVFQDVVTEEKTHVGEFQAMLLREDKEQVAELKGGKKEVEKLLR